MGERVGVRGRRSFMQLMNASESLLLVVDMQEKLLPTIHANEELCNTALG